MTSHLWLLLVFTCYSGTAEFTFGNESLQLDDECTGTSSNCTVKLLQKKSKLRPSKSLLTAEHIPTPLQFDAWAYGPHKNATNKYTPDALKDLVTNLPGSPQGLSFNVFSGYIPVLDGDMFYMHFESAAQPSSDPLVWWTNGGPGASGLMTAFAGYGPFHVSQDEDLSINPASWNQLVNLVIVEQPLGVGFSTNHTPVALTDVRSAENNYAFLERFLDRFPHLKTVPVYLASESYGGHYVPTLAKTVVEKGGSPAAHFQGFLVGNPVSVDQWSSYAQLRTLVQHDMLPRDWWDNFKHFGCPRLWALPGEPRAIPGNDWNQTEFQQCLKLIEAGFARASLPSHDKSPPIDVYAFDFPDCPRVQEVVTDRVDFDDVLTKEQQGMLKDVSAINPGAMYSKYFPYKYDNCIKVWQWRYLHRADVRAALHVLPNAPKWETLSLNVFRGYDKASHTSPMPPIYDYLSKKDLRMLVFSGDGDLSVPTAATQDWIWWTGGTWEKVQGVYVLCPGNKSDVFVPEPCDNCPESQRSEEWYWKDPKRRQTESEWGAWTIEMPSLGKQVAGYHVKFTGGLSFMTVMGAGHEVALTRPWASLQLLQNFLNGEV
eukprot:TRINITY_DN91608_c0_g1_i1.p1 TRINITY_DN91608_c0_g1~~TRINITY_DN91608_c0_g1_i1.p1  ORF type:complete len:600 (-),score=65.41 TRINITY_DN91608_c0_g1_i1:76-1875(-)